MADSSTNPENGLFRLRSTPSNEHFIFAETLRDWRDPLLQGYEPIPVPLCPRCSTCKCESLKDLPDPSSHSIHHHGRHEVSCPNFRHQTDRAKTPSKQRLLVKPKRRAASHDPSISLLNTSSSSSSIVKCKSAEHSPIVPSMKRKKSTSKIPIRVSTPPSSLIKHRISENETQIPRLMLPSSIPPLVAVTDDLYEIDSLNGDIYRTPTMMSDTEKTTNEAMLVKNKKKKHKRRSRCRQGRHSKSKQTTNDLSSSNSSSSSSSLSVVPLRKKSRSYRLSSPSQVLSSLSDDSLSGKFDSKQRPRSAFASTDQPTSRSVPPSVYLIQLTNQPSNLIRTITYVWKNINSKNEEEERSVYPYYSIEQVPPIITGKQRSLSRNISLQRSQTDLWHNSPTSIDSILTSSCENSIGSASHLLLPSSATKSSDIPKNSHQGHVISITTTKRQQPSLLNKTSNVPEETKPHRYSQIQWHSVEQFERKHGVDKPMDTKASPEPNHQSGKGIIHREGPTNVLQEIHTENLPMNRDSNQTNSVPPEVLITKTPPDPASISQPNNPTQYASTDEDVDELNSHYSEDVDRSVRTTEDYREKLNTRLAALNAHPTGTDHRSRILSTEYSQITLDSGVDVITEQKVYQPNTTLTIDEQSFEEITDQNDLFALSDDSLVDLEEKAEPNQSILEHTEQETFFSAKSDLNYEKDIYSGYELETITDEEEDEHRHLVNENSSELILATEPTPPPAPPSIPSQFEFKLPSFGEWIDRVFTNFLTENSNNSSPSIASSRSSSMHGSQNTINTSSSSQVITILENPNLFKDDEQSLHDMSSSSLNSEKVDFDTYIINSNYEKINPSITNQANEIPFISERSKSFLSSITSSIENDDQEIRTSELMANDNENDFQREGCQYSSNSRDSLLQFDHHYINTTTSSIDDLTRANQFLSSTFHSKDSALGLSDDYLNRPSSNDLIGLTTDDHAGEKNEAATTTVPEETMLTMDTINDDHSEKETNVERTVSSSSSEQLIPKEKQTGMYYKAFGSSAAIHLTEQYQCEWLQADRLTSPPMERPSEVDENHLRIVHQSEIIGDNEDEFYLSPRTLQPSCSCPALHSKLLAPYIRQRSYSLTTLDAYTHLNITHETLEQIWLSLLDVAFSDKDDCELGEDKLRHIISLSDSYSNLNASAIEKSRSHNDIFSIMTKLNPNTIAKNKSKSFDITSLIKQSTTTHDSANMGLLQGADISEPFADRVLSASVHSDLESIQSMEQESTPRETFSPPAASKEPLDFVFNFTQQTDPDDFDLEDKPLEISLTFDEDDLPPVIQMQDTYAALSLFRPHSLSTIPSSRASQYASSVESDDPFDQEGQMSKEFCLDNVEEQEHNHLSDDDHGLIGSEFSSPQSRPLSSIQSRSSSPEQNQGTEKSIRYENLLVEYNHPEELLSADEDLENSKLLVQVKFFEDEQISTIDRIEPFNKPPDEIFVDKSTVKNEPEQTAPAIAHLFSIVDDIQQISQLQTSLSPLPESRSSVLRNSLPVRHQHQRFEKVSDLEIVKQGKGFKIGYIDRQGTDQRVILTKRIEASPDIIERDPHVRLPYKGRRILNQMFSSVLYTNGYNALKEDEKFQHSADDIEIPIIGTNPKHFDESDMISIDIDGPSTMLSSICESLVITQGSVYSNTASAKAVFHQSEEVSLQTSHPSNKEKIEVIDSWHDQTIINGGSTAWRSPFKPIKPSQSSSTNPPQVPHIEPTSRNADKPTKSTRDIALSPVLLPAERQYHTISTSPIIVPQTVDRSCQYSPPAHYDQSFQCYFATIPAFTQVSSHEIPGLLKTHEEIQTNDHSAFRPLLTTLERSADSGILLDDHHRMKSNLALQVDMKSSSSDSEDISEINTHSILRPTLTSNTNIYANYHTNTSPNEMDQEMVQLRRERAHVLDLLSLNWSRSNIWVELTEAKLNYIIGETDALLRSLSFDPTPVDNETIKTKMHQYEVDMAELTRQHLAVYRERLEDSKKQLDMKINQLESKKSSNETLTTNSRTIFEHTPRSKRSTSFLSTSADNLTIEPIEETIASHPQLLDISFLTSQTPDQYDEPTETIQTIYRPTARYPVLNEYQFDRSNRSNNGNLSTMEGLSKSQQAILDETDELVKDSQQLHSESASQFERARESLLSSETSIRQARANLAASRQQRPYSEKKTYLPNDVTLAELFKYEQSLAKEAAAAKNNRQVYSSTES